MNRSIDLLEARAAESDNSFAMNRRGYCFLTSTAEGKARHLEAAAAATRTGLGSAQVYSGAEATAYRHDKAFDASVEGLSVYSGSEAIRSFLGPLGDFVAPEVQSVMHAGRCGWMNAQQMGMQFMALGSQEELRDQIIQAGLSRACLQLPLPANAGEFNTRRDEGKARLNLLVNEIARLIGQILGFFE